MVNLYKLLNVLEQGMSLFQLNKWKTEGIWYPITQYKKESDEIQVVTNLFIADQEQYHIQLSGNYPEESEAWDKFLEENQWKIYPLLANIMQVFLPTGTILTLIRNEKIYQAHKHTHPTNKNKGISSHKP